MKKPANSEKKIDLQRLFGYNISRMTVTVISYVLLRPGRAVEHIEFDRGPAVAKAVAEAARKSGVARI